MKTFLRRIHLYLAFGAGLIIMVTCLTGAILVFEKELMQVFNKNRYYTTTQGKRLPLDTLLIPERLWGGSYLKNGIPASGYGQPLNRCTWHLSMVCRQR